MNIASEIPIKIVSIVQPSSLACHISLPGYTIFQLDKDNEVLLSKVENVLLYSDVDILTNTHSDAFFCYFCNIKRAT